MPTYDEVVEQINNCLVEVEKFSNEFLPLQNTLSPIQENLNNTLQDLKYKSENSTDLSDKVFYFNRYTDLVKKVEGIFEARSKRLQQTLQTLSKLSPTRFNNQDSIENDGTEDARLTPEQCNTILKILNNKE